MSRLTIGRDNKTGRIKTSTHKWICFERLAQYEDTGLEPEEVSELAQAKADGRCVVLPCKVGDTLYKLWYEPCHNGEDRPDGMGCAGCIDECDIKRAVVPFTANSVEHIVGMRNSLNRFWFLTSAEAEEALKGAEHE